MYCEKFFKVVFLVLVTFFGFSETKGQSYVSMINDSLYWDVHEAVQGNKCAGYGNGGFRYFIGKDTTINSLTFTQILSHELISDSATADCPPFSAHYKTDTTHYYIHETNNGKIYLHNDSTGITFLLFDYKMKQGDFIFYPNGKYFYVDTIVTYNTREGITRKRYIDNNVHNSYPSTGEFVEGIGGVAGPVQPPLDYVNDGYWLKCWDYFGHNFNDCWEMLSTGVNSFAVKETTINLYPNPASSSVQLVGHPDIRSIRITDMQGKVVLRKNISSPAPIRIDHLQPGIYSAQIQYGENKFAGKKLMILPR